MTVKSVGKVVVHMLKIFKLQNRALQIINFEDFCVNPNPLYINKTSSDCKTVYLYMII